MDNITTIERTTCVNLQNLLRYWSTKNYAKEKNSIFYGQTGSFPIVIDEKRVHKESIFESIKSQLNPNK